MELLEIEKELSSADGQAAMDKYDRQLCGLGDRLKSAMDNGLAPEDFARCSNLAEAVVIARKLLRIQRRNG